MTSNDKPSTGSEFLNVLVEKAEHKFLNVLVEHMTESARTAADRSQQAVIEALANWAATTQTMLSQQPPTPEALQATMPKPTEFVDRGFEIAEQLLQAQHSFVKKLMESVQGPLTEAAKMAASAAPDASDSSAANPTGTGTASDEAAYAGDSMTKTVKNAFSKSGSAAS